MKKALTVILSVVLFVVLAGGVMFGVNALSKTVNGQQTEQAAVEESKQEAAPEKIVTGENENLQPTAAVSKDSTISHGETIVGGVTAIDVSDVVEACMPEVVAITNTTVIQQQGYNSFYDYFYGRGNSQPQEYTTTAAGSGVIIHETDDELLIVTNNHVVEGATELEVTFIDGKTAKAEFKGNGGDVDIAVIAIPLSEIEDDTKAAIKIAKVHEEDDLKPGQGVIAIGNSLGYGQTVTVGVISALEREIQSSRTEVYTNLIQTDAAINPGNSGGALLNNEGELIGINVAKLADTDIEGVGFAIPLYTVADIIEDLYNTKTKVELETEDQGRLGVYMNTISSEQSTALNMPAGVIILGFSDEVIEGYEDQGQQYSPAKEAGLQKNDIIVKFDGQTVTDAQSLSDLVKYYEAGSKVDIVVERISDGEYKQKTFTVTLGSKNDEKTGVNTDTKADSKDGAKDGGEFEQKKPDGQEAPEEGEAPEENGENGQNGENGSYDYNDMYEFFRRYIEQYQR